jgi:O-antigen/teichoic acid export membrane protein
MRASDTSGRGWLIARGITWNALFQFFEIAISFGAMLVLVRIIPPVEYGRFGAVLGLLTLLNSFNVGAFMAQALQLPEGQEPDWSLHWTAGLYVQGALMLACNALAAVCWLTPSYQPIAPLLHLGALGFLLDWPARLRVVMLRRELAFGRMKALLACSTALQLAVTILGGLLGAGAYAIVFGANVVTPLPLAVDLLFVDGWRPRADWWRWPDWTAYRPALVFGAQQGLSGLLGSVRVALEGAVLPRAVGYAAIGLLNRAQALSATTVGRIGAVLVETAYPLLPRYATDAASYARQAALFIQVLLLAAIPGVVYIGLEGRALSRVLYGDRWIAADPLIWPAALGALGLAAFGAGASVLLAAGRLRASFLLNVLAALLSAPMVVVAWIGGHVVTYAWALAAGQLAAGAIALVSASPLLAPRWAPSVVAPPAVASLGGLGAVVGIARFELVAPVFPELALESSVFFLVVALTLRAMFPGPLTRVLSRAPGGDWLGSWLGLPVGHAASTNQ